MDPPPISITRNRVFEDVLRVVNRILGRMSMPDGEQPEILRKRMPPEDPPRAAGPEVGAFRQGTPFSQAALSRYLVGRALIESVGAALLIVAGLLVLLAVASSWLAHSTLLAVLLVLVALFVLLMRWAVLTVVRRLTGFGAGGGELNDRMRALVRDTRPDVLRELRRIGLPGRTATLPLLAARLLSRRRRADTLARLRRFEIERAVPPARLDELHLVVRGARPPEPGPTGR
jgi:hypothetical protein